MATGWIERTLGHVKLLTEQVDTSLRWTPDQIFTVALYPAYAAALTELLAVSQNEPILRLPVTLVTGQKRYLLPPCVGTVREFVRMDTVYTGVPAAEIYPSQAPLLTTRRVGWGIEGNALVLNANPEDIGEAGQGWEIHAVPSGEFSFHSGVTSTSPTSTTFTFVSAPQYGDFDTRQNAYAGCLLRIYQDSAGYVQERFITAYNHQTMVATIGDAFSPTPSGTIQYEVLPPIWGPLMFNAVSQLAAAHIVRGAKPEVADGYERKARECIRLVLKHYSRQQGRKAITPSEEGRDSSNYTYRGATPGYM